jgi:hypothetical protein
MSRIGSVSFRSRRSPSEFDVEMLKVFATNPGRVLSKQELMEAVWPDIHVGEYSLFQSIRELRTALGDEQRQIIKLMSGRAICSQPRCRVWRKWMPPAPRIRQSEPKRRTNRAGAIPACGAAPRSLRWRGSA